MANDQDLLKKAYEAVEVARKTGKIKKGTNETTKAIERGVAKFVVIAADANPVEITLHLAPLCAEKKVPFWNEASKEELGAAAGLSVATVSVAIVQEGDAADLLKEIVAKLK
ncbi:50S ribosomal protein L7ae [Candidatus Woesearchaeota archaeon]|nr:50S ribosomal protein L7ae [Candidatus Woesearchaeota archaeon]